MKKISAPFPIIPAGDFLQSLLRSKAYLDDYAAHAKFLSAWETEDPPQGRERDVLGIRDQAPLNQANLNAYNHQAFNEGKRFLVRWPALIYPIPPHRALKNPEYFLQYLHAPVEIQRGPAGKTKVAAKYGISERLVLFSDLRDGRFLIAKIDASRPKEEILTSLGREIDKYRGAGWGLPEVNARTSKPKKSKLDLSSRRWEVWDIHVGKAKRFIRKTATILFPREYSSKLTKEEVKAEAEKFLADKGGRDGLRGRDFTTYELLLGASATKGRTEKWKNIEKEVRRVINSCEAYIAAHKPIETQI
jgi:hypothetical protein